MTITGNDSRFWHPFANMVDITGTRGRVVFVSGEGTTLTDSEGNRYFDATAGLWATAVGHGREQIVRAIAEQAAKLASTSCFDIYGTDVTLEAADRIAELTPVRDPRVFLTSGGSDGIDSAGKIIRRHFVLRGEPDKTVFISRQSAYHGMHAYGTALTGIEPNPDATWGPLVREVEHITAFNAEALEEKIQEVGEERVAAFFVEPVIGAGGVYPPTEGYLRAVRDICDRHGVLMVCDEVITGFGRLGSWSASERFGIEPDVMNLAKILTSGYQPLGAVVVSGKVAEPFFTGEGDWFKHGYTYSGHATACAAALANLDLIEEEQLIDRVAELEPIAARLLEPLADLDGISEVRTIGLLGGIQLDLDWLAERGATPTDVADAVRERGHLTRPLASGGLQFSPPFICSEDEIAAFADATAEAVAVVVA